MHMMTVMRSTQHGDRCPQIPDATDDAVAALASIPSPPDAKPCSVSTTSSPSARASVASSARAPRVAFALPGKHDGMVDAVAEDMLLHDAVALEVEESVCGTEAGTLDSIRRCVSVCVHPLIFIALCAAVCVHPLVFSLRFVL